MADENTNSQKITSLENRIERQTLPPREAERKAPMQGDEGRQRVKVPEQELRKELPKEESKENVYVTRAEVQDALNGLMTQIAALCATKSDLNNINMAIASIARNVDANFVTRPQAEKIAKDAVPATIRDIDSSASKRTGNTLMLSAGGASGRDSVYFGTPVSGLTAKGDKVLYKGIFLREYDENGVIVAAGSELNPSDYATQALYDAALTAISHTLNATWDYERGYGNITGDGG